VAFEHQEHAAPCRVGEGGQILENRYIHPYIRMECYINRGFSQLARQFEV
jgi:hypothetical protein